MHYDSLVFASEVQDELKHLVSLRPASNAPLRPVRACVLGPLGAGRTTLARRLASHYGAVHVDAAALVRDMKEKGVVIMHPYFTRF